MRYIKIFSLFILTFSIGFVFTLIIDVYETKVLQLVSDVKPKKLIITKETCKTDYSFYSNADAIKRMCEIYYAALLTESNIKDRKPSETSNPIGAKRVEIESLDIKNTLGLISATDKLSEKGSSIRIYNRDGSLWYKFTNNRDATDMRVLKFDNENFSPYLYNADELYVYLKCVGQDKKYYHVIVNEETRLKKFIKKDDPIFELRTWEQYVLDQFAVEFDNEKNPLRIKPNGKIIKYDKTRHLTFHTEKIKGNWLKVRWYENNDRDTQPKFGWIKWKENHRIILNLFGSC